MVEVLGTTGFMRSSTREELDAWVDTDGITVTSVIDADGMNRQSVDALVQREAFVIVELPAMKVVYTDLGDVLGQNPSSVGAGLAKAHELLAGGT